MRQFLVLFSFFVITPSLLIAAILTLFVIAYPPTISQTSEFSMIPSKNLAYAALPSNQNTLDGEVIQGDARIARVKNFLDSYNSPLAAYAERIVEDADIFNIDYRLVPSISVQESGGCKKIIEDSFNCFGFGIYGKTVTKFSNFGQAIDTVSKYLGKHADGGLITPHSIGTLYNPSNHNNWSENVQNFMNSI